jgi:hypothetical protein
LKQYFLTPFQTENGLNKTLLAIFGGLNLIVLVNALIHVPYVGYDALEHIEYIKILSEFRFPTLAETGEFFSPPLPYVGPALLLATKLFNLQLVLKLAQFGNFVLSLGLTFFLLKICDLIKPGFGSFKIATLIFVGISPVYYRSFAFIRGEPQIAFLAVLIMYLGLKIFYMEKARISSIVILGILLGLSANARQWGFFLFPAVGLFVVILGWKRRKLWVYASRFGLAVMISFLVGSWFYFHLKLDYGTFSAFNRKPGETFSLTNQPREFYTGKGWGLLFKTPFREVFLNQLLPTLYADYWGDYWAYFNAYGRNLDTDEFVGGRLLLHHLKKEKPDWMETNLPSVIPYLGKVNLVSLIPSILIVGGILVNFYYFVVFMKEKRPGVDIAGFSFSGFLLLISAVGYLWFLVQYPKPTKGDTIKATYMLQTIPFIALAAGNFLDQINQKSRLVFGGILFLLGIVFIHNFPVLISNYVYWEQLPITIPEIFIRY